MQPITETCLPRTDVLAGGLEDRHFAAQLDRVVADDPAYASYTNPGQFFASTHPTSGLQEMIGDVFGHLAGQGGRPILRAQTNFGGGKTHALIALYHLARGFRPDNVEEFTEAALLPHGPVRAAAVVGDSLDPLTGTSTSGRTTFTLWGELGAQLGAEAWEAVAEADAQRTAPGTATIRRMLDGGPTVIVIDEIAQYLRVCDDSGSPDVRRQAGQIAPFLQRLSGEVIARDDVALVITLATSDDAYRAQTEKVSNALAEAFKDVRSVSARRGGDVQPAAESEIAAILKRRLFAEVSQAAAGKAGRAYAELYATTADSLALSQQDAGDIAARIAETYPFHPALVDVLDKRIGTLPEFQRTRGALRLLSLVVGQVWADPERAPAILNAADVPLEDDRVLQELTVKIGRHGFQQVAQADIIGAGSHSRTVDQHAYQSRPVTRRAATTVLLHSLEQTPGSGATGADVAKGTLRPGDDPALLEDALGRLYDRAWHLSWDNVRWRFQTEPNANRIVADQADRVTPSRVRDEREAILRRMLRPTATIQTHVYPEDLDGVPDEPRLHLAVPHHDTVAVTVKDADPAPPLLQQTRERHHGRPRANRNGIAYLVADTDRVEDMQRAVRKMIAAGDIVDDDTQMAGYSEQVSDKLRNIADTSLLEAHVAVGRCYRHLYHPTAHRGGGDLGHVELTANVQGALGDRIPAKGNLPEGKAWTDQVWHALVAAEKVRPADKPLAAEWVAQKAWPSAETRIRSTAVLEAFWRDHSAPLLADTGPLTQAIQQGVLVGLWVVQDMREATDGRGKVWSNRDGATPRPVTLDPEVWLVGYETAVGEGLLATPTSVADIARVINDADETLSATELRQRIEQAKGGHEPSKDEVRAALADAIRQERALVYRGDDLVKAGDLTGDRVGFDDLRITDYSSEDAGDYQPTIPKRRHFEGAAATAAENLTAWTAELINGGHTTGLTEVTITVEVDEDTPTTANTLILLLGSVPNLDAALDIDLNYRLDAVDGDVTVTITGADRRQASQKVRPLLTALTEKGATPLDGTAALRFVLDQPHQPDSPTLTGLRQAVTTYFTGGLRISGRVA